MKAKIDINFIEVSGHKVDKKMQENKRFRKSTIKTVKKLCQQIEKYFRDFNINVKTTHEIE